MLCSYIGNVFITLVGIYSGDGNLDWFIDVGGLCGIDIFCDTGVSSCDGGRGG